MEITAVLQQIFASRNEELLSAQALAGGDINQVFKVSSDSGEYVIKLNHRQRYPGMFQAEAKGLQLLKSSDTFKIPNVIDTGHEGSLSYLILEHVNEGMKSASFWEVFAKRLADLHRTTHDAFGLDHTNYIGSLVQYNHRSLSGSEFYINSRLEPQFKLAFDAGYNFKGLDQFYKQVSKLLPDEAPALVHGDLWNGNYMVNQNGNPVLIDPAVAFSFREADLAMMRLFGGFDRSVFDIYNEEFPLAAGADERIGLFQLYFILVHLNLFGSGYLAQVQNIIAEYS